MLQGSADEMRADELYHAGSRRQRWTYLDATRLISLKHPFSIGGHPAGEMTTDGGAHLLSLRW